MRINTKQFLILIIICILICIPVFIMCYYCIGDVTDVALPEILSQDRFNLNNYSNDNYCKFIYNNFGVDKNYNFSYDDLIKHDDFTYFPHYVTLHIQPIKPEVNVSIKINDSCFQNTQSIAGYTNNNSEVVFPMMQTLKYDISIDSEKCVYHIYPYESYYELGC